MVFEILHSILTLILTFTTGFLTGKYFEDLLPAERRRRISRLVKKPQGAVMVPQTEEEERAEKNAEFYKNIPDEIEE